MELKYKYNNLLNKRAGEIEAEIYKNINNLENNIWDLKLISNMETSQINNKINLIKSEISNLIKNIKLNKEE